MLCTYLWLMPMCLHWTDAYELLFLKLEALKEQNKIVKQQEKAEKRKKEKEATSAGVEPAAKKAKKVRKV